MHAHIELAIRRNQIRSLWEPGAGYHNRACATGAEREEFSKCQVGSVSHSNVVFMKHDRPATKHPEFVDTYLRLGRAYGVPILLVKNIVSSNVYCTINARR